MALITYSDKQAMGTQPSIPDVNKVTDFDMNEIKNGINNSTTYSTTEQVIGTWINGKPIYRVVKNIGNLPNNGRKEVSFSGIIPIGVVCTKIYGIAERTLQSVIDYNNLKDVCSLLMYRATNNILYVDTSEDRSNYTGYVVIEYTKTTD